MRLPASISPAPLAWLLLAAALIVLAASTHSVAGALADGVYTSNLGYKIQPPKGWKAVDRGNHGVLSEVMPTSLAAAPATGYDVMFFDGTLEEPADGAPEPIFDNIIVVMVPGAPAELSTASAAALAEAVKPELTKLFPGSVTLTAATTAKHAGVDAIDLEWSVEGADGAHKGFVMQSVLPADGQSLVVTCTIDAARAEDFKSLCTAVVDSVKLP